MNRLFTKIFLGFWLTTIVVVLAVHLGGRYLEWANPDDRRPPWELRREAGELLHQAQHAMRSGEAMDEWLERQQLPREFRVGLFDAGNQPLAGEPDAAMLRQIARLGREHPGLRVVEDERLYMARILFQRGRPALKMVVAMPHPERGNAVIWLQRHFWAQVIIALLASGLLCYALARLAVRPILSLRHATRKLAAGDLDTRIPAPDSGGDEITGLSRDFNHMAARLQHTIEDQKQLVRDISHELRSPLGRIQAALALAQRRQAEPLPELERVTRECERLNELIGELLVIPEQEVTLEDVIDLPALLHNLVDDNHLAAQEAGCELQLRNLQEPLLLRTHRDLLYRALDNVLRNAIRHTRPGTVVTLSAEHDARAITLRVTDHGPGVAEDMLARIFLPFYRVQSERLQSARERGNGGYGLGLSIAQRAVQQHGGQISARNRTPPDEGLDVTIQLPPTLIAEVP